MRNLTYAYPTSEQAAKLGYSKTGCWIVGLSHHEYAFVSSRAALKRFDDYPHLTIGANSFFGPQDSDTNRRQRMTDNK